MSSAISGISDCGGFEKKCYDNVRTKPHHSAIFISLPILPFLSYILFVDL